MGKENATDEGQRDTDDVEVERSVGRAKNLPTFYVHYPYRAA